MAKVFGERDPFEDVEKMRRRMRRMMRAFWEPFAGFREELEYDSFPVDISEIDGELMLKADLPGFEKDEVKVRITDDSVDIMAVKKREKKEVTETMYRQERAMGSVRRALTLPTKVDSDEVKAEFKNGVLTLRMRKKEAKKKGKEVKIE